MLRPGNSPGLWDKSVPLLRADFSDCGSREGRLWLSGAGLARRPQLKECDLEAEPQTRCPPFACETRTVLGMRTVTPLPLLRPCRARGSGSPFPSLTARCRDVFLFWCLSATLVSTAQNKGKCRKYDVPTSPPHTEMCSELEHTRLLHKGIQCTRNPFGQKTVVFPT